MIEYEFKDVKNEVEEVTAKVMESLMVIRQGKMPNDDAYLDLRERVEDKIKWLLEDSLREIALEEIKRGFQF